MDSTLAKTPLQLWHAAHGGRMVDFAGWSMPVQYTSIVAEHNATRQAAGLFDVSHMGRLQFFGPDVPEFLDHVVTRRVADMRPNQVRYALVTNDQGGIIDDVLVNRGSVGGKEFGMVVNASNREKIVGWLRAQLERWQVERKRDAQLSFGDTTMSSAMIAIQGPKAADILEPFLGAFVDSSDVQNIHDMKYYTCTTVDFDDYEMVRLSRTGYTGEDGFEIICEQEQALGFWDKLVTAASKHGGLPAGLACRDTLRLEAGMPLYGHELNEQITPLDAGLDFAVNLEGRTFPGSEVLAQQKQKPLPKKRVGLQLDGKRVPREGYPVLQAGRPIGADPIGTVTSGTFSPTLDRPIAMAYVDSAAATPGTNLAIDIRGQAVSATVVPLPFYRRKK